MILRIKTSFVFILGFILLCGVSAQSTPPNGDLTREIIRTGTDYDSASIEVTECRQAPGATSASILQCIRDAAADLGERARRSHTTYTQRAQALRTSNPTHTIFTALDQCDDPNRDLSLVAQCKLQALALPAREPSGVALRPLRDSAASLVGSYNSVSALHRACAASLTEAVCPSSMIVSAFRGGWSGNRNANNNAPTPPRTPNRRNARNTATGTSTATSTSTSTSQASAAAANSTAQGDLNAELRSAVAGTAANRPACQRTCGGNGTPPNFCLEDSCNTANGSTPLSAVRQPGNVIAQITGELSMQEVAARFSAEKNVESFIDNLAMQEGMTGPMAQQFMEQLAGECGRSAPILSDTVTHVRSSIQHYIENAKGRAAAKVVRANHRDSALNDQNMNSLIQSVHEIHNLEAQIAALQGDFPAADDATWAHAYQESLGSMINPCPHAAEAITGAADINTAAGALCTASGTPTRMRMQATRRNIQFSRADNSTLSLQGQTTAGDAIALQSMHMEAPRGVAVDDTDLCSVKLNLLLTLRARRAAILNEKSILLSPVPDGPHRGIPLHQLLSRHTRTDQERIAQIRHTAQSQIYLQRTTSDDVVDAITGATENGVAINGVRARGLADLSPDSSLGILRDSIKNICGNGREAGRSFLRDPSAANQLLNCFGRASQSGLSSNSVCNQSLSPELGQQFCSTLASATALSTDERIVAGGARVIQPALTALGTYGCATVVGGLIAKAGTMALRQLVARELLNEAGAVVGAELRSTTGMAIRSALQAARGSGPAILTAIRNPISTLAAAGSSNMVRDILRNTAGNFGKQAVGIALVGNAPQFYEGIWDPNGTRHYMRGNMLAGITDGEYLRDLESRQPNLAHFVKDFLVGAIVDPSNLLGNHVPHLTDVAGPHGIPLGWYSHFADILGGNASHDHGRGGSPYREPHLASDLHAQLEAASRPDATPAQRQSFAEAFRRSLGDMLTAARERPPHNPDLISQLDEINRAMEHADPADLVRIAGDIRRIRRHVPQIQRHAVGAEHGPDSRISDAVRGCAGDLNCVYTAAARYLEAAHQSGTPAHSRQPGTAPGTDAGARNPAVAASDAAPVAPSMAPPGSSPLRQALASNPQNRNIIGRIVNRVRTAAGRRQIANVDTLLAQRDSAAQRVLNTANDDNRAANSPHATAVADLRRLDNQLHDRVNELVGREGLRDANGAPLNVRNLSNPAHVRDVAEAVSFGQFSRDFARQLGVDPNTNPQISSLLGEVHRRVRERFQTPEDISRADNEAIRRTETDCHRPGAHL